MTWSRAHRRHQLVHAVLADIERDRRPEIPARWKDEIDAEFGGFDEFLRDVQARWYRAFDARLDPLLETGAPDLRAELIRIWDGLADCMPAARLLLDAHLGNPALTPLHDRQRRMVHLATGVLWDPTNVPRPSPPARAARRPIFQPCRWLIAPGGVR